MNYEAQNIQDLYNSGKITFREAVQKCDMLNMGSDFITYAVQPRDAKALQIDVVEYVSKRYIRRY